MKRHINTTHHRDRHNNALRWLLRGGTLLISTGMAILTPLVALARPGVLSAGDAGAVINIRTRPTLQSTAVYLGRPGDRVNVIEEVQGSDRMPWYFIQLDGDNVAGWVRGDLVSFTLAQSNTTPQGVPAEALEACRNRAFVELNTFRADIDITQARIVSPGIYSLTWRQGSTDLTGQCTVNATNSVTAFTTAQSTPQPAPPNQPQTTLYDFRTDDYAVRIYRLAQSESNQAYINLWDIEGQTFALQGEALQSESAGGVTVFWVEQGEREYQIRVLQNNQFIVRISTANAVEYEGNSV